MTYDAGYYPTTIDELLTECESRGWALGYLSLFDGVYNCNLETDTEVTVMATGATPQAAIAAAMRAEWREKQGVLRFDEPSTAEMSSLRAVLGLGKPKQLPFKRR